MDDGFLALDGPRPVNLLICALGGEGGGVLMNWIVGAAADYGLPVQSTSVPGVAQRTGATTYYIEIFPVPLAELGGREPVLGLYPCVGDVDLVVASELVEAGRAMERGWVNPERTLLIASTHRVLAIAEKSAATDGRYDSRRVLEAAPKMAQEALLFDAQKESRESRCPVNAVLLGALAGCRRLPIPPEVFAAGIRREGKAVEANLAGFERGLAIGRAQTETVPQRIQQDGDAGESPKKRHDPPPGPASHARLAQRRQSYPQICHEVLAEAERRLVDFQDLGYAELYLERLEAFFGTASKAAIEAELLAELARQLALAMSYEDVIRVAQLKTRRRRWARVRAESGAAPDQIVRVTELLKPSVEELCSILPPLLARPILSWAEKRGIIDKLSLDIELKSTTVSGFLRLWIVAKLRPFRRMGQRYREEQAWIEEWLDLVREALAKDAALAREVVECAGLVKGYGATRRRGLEHFRRIVDEQLRPAVAGRVPAQVAAKEIHAQRTAALGEPEQAGSRLATV